MGALTIADCCAKIAYYKRRRSYYQGLIDGYNIEKNAISVLMNSINEARNKLDRMTEQFNHCHQKSVARVMNTSGLDNINNKLVLKLTSDMNELVNGQRYHKARLSIQNQYAEIDWKMRTKQNRINTLNGNISGCNSNIANCNYWIDYYEKKIKTLSAS